MYELLIIFIVWIIVLIASLRIVWINKHKSFFIHRSVTIIFITQTSILVASIIIATSLMKMSPEFCIILNWTYCISLPICMLSSNLMSPSLIINSHLNRMKPERARRGHELRTGACDPSRRIFESANHTHSFSNSVQRDIWQLRHFCTIRAKLIFLAIICVVQMIIYCILQYTTKLDDDVGASQHDCQDYSVYPFTGIMTTCLIPISFGFYKLIHVDDPYSMRFEIIITAIFHGLSMIGIILFIAGKLPFQLQYVFLYAMIVVFICNLILPVILHLRKPMLHHNSEEDVREILKNSNSSLLMYSVRNYVAENILFYQAVDLYREFPTDEKATFIFNEYIEIDAPLQVNIDDIIYQCIKSGKETPTPDLFDRAQNAIRKLIVESILPGWRQADCEVNSDSLSVVMARVREYLN